MQAGAHPPSPLAGEGARLGDEGALVAAGEGAPGVSRELPTAPSPTPTRQQVAKSAYPLPQGERMALRPVTNEQFEVTLLARAKYMRANPTEAERRLWAMLRNKRFVEYKFKRQQIIAPYIVDFVCFDARVIIEADGSQHADNRHDARRDAFLHGQGFHILRLWNNEILANRDGISEAIWNALQPSSPLAGEERDLVRNELSRSGEGACESSRETPTAPSPRLARATSCQANLSSPAGGEGF